MPLISDPTVMATQLPFLRLTLSHFEGKPGRRRRRICSPATSPRIAATIAKLPDC
jgi:hypothetical protein